MTVEPNETDLAHDTEPPDRADRDAVVALAVGRALLAITDEASYVLGVEPNQAKWLAKKLTGRHVDPDAVLSAATKIPHKKLILIAGDEKTGKIEFRYQSLKSLATYGMGSTELIAPDVETHAAVFAALQNRLGEGARHKRKVQSSARALAEPFIFAFFALFCTWVFAGGLGDLSEHKPSGKNRLAAEFIDWVVSIIGQQGVIAIGTVVTLGCMLWAYKRFQNPPIVVTLRPGKHLP